jgi:glutamate synthase (NADPH/NADH) small chain
MEEMPTFMKVQRQSSGYRVVSERIKDYSEVAVLRETAVSEEQASRCARCGVPFCHWRCPLGNYMPDLNSYLTRGQWEDAFLTLQSTHNFPEFTGRLCPALCESACVLGIYYDPITVRENELAIVEHAFEAGFVKPRPPVKRTGQSVAVVGSGPSGLACADQLNKAGHRAVVFERDSRPGGILRYGIPDFKLEKRVIDRRLKILKAEGIEFLTDVNVGVSYPAARLLKEFDAVCLTTGFRVPRDLAIEGRSLEGIHFAMEYLGQSNRRVAGEQIPLDDLIDARGKRVVVIGGGDTGADCVGTAHRQGAASVVQIELLPQPPKSRGPNDHWPEYPNLLKTSTSHEEGGQRQWAIQTKLFIGKDERLTGLSCVRLEWSQSDPKSRPVMREIPESGFELKSDLVLLALGFVAGEPNGLLKELGLTLDAQGRVATDHRYQTAREGIFAAGDLRRGQSLIVWAISEGRRAAHYMDKYLMGQSELPLI